MKWLPEWIPESGTRVVNVELPDDYVPPSASLDPRVNAEGDGKA